MAKNSDSDWNGPQGSDDMGKGQTKASARQGLSQAGRYHSKVDPSWKRTDGFSAKLDRGE